jgi:hypothetical protein
MTLREGASYLLRIATRRILRAAPGRGSSPGPQSACRAAFRRYLPATDDGRPLLILAESETAAYSDDPKADWQALSRDGVDVLVLPGDHEDVLVEPNVKVVADHLRRKLAAPSRTSSEKQRLGLEA